MNTVDVMRELGEMGVRYPKHKFDMIYKYIDSMIKDNRVLLIFKDQRVQSYITFSITNNPEKYLKKGSWDYLSHDPNGSIIYIEQLITKEWNRKLRLGFEQTVTEMYPSIEYGMWHRWAKWGDRKVISKRRIDHVRN